MHAIERAYLAAAAMLRRAWKARDGHALRTASARFDRARGRLPAQARGRSAAETLARWSRRDRDAARRAARASTKSASTNDRSSLDQICIDQRWIEHRRGHRGLDQILIDQPPIEH